MADRRYALIGHTHSSSTEVNDLSAAVTWANIPIANVPTGVTGAEVSLGNHVHEGTAIDATAVTNGYVLTADGAGNSAWVASAEVNNLSAAVTWANIPIANVPTGTSSVTVALGDHLHTGVYLASAGTAANSQLLDSLDSLAFARVGTTAGAGDNYLYNWRSNATSPPLYVRQAGAGDICRFFTNATASTTSGTSQVTITNTGGITATDDVSAPNIGVTSTTAALAAVGNAINTAARKVAGFMVFNTTTSKPVWAAGAADASVWVDATGATAHSPV